MYGPSCLVCLELPVTHSHVSHPLSQLTSDYATLIPLVSNLAPCWVEPPRLEAKFPNGNGGVCVGGGGSCLFLLSFFRGLPQTRGDRLGGEADSISSAFTEPPGKQGNTLYCIPNEEMKAA